MSEGKQNLQETIGDILRESLETIGEAARLEYISWAEELSPIIEQISKDMAAGGARAEIAQRDLEHLRAQAESRARLLQIESSKLSASTAGKVALTVALAVLKLI